MESNSALTLTQVAYYGRLAVKFFIFLVIFLIVGRTFLNAFNAYWKATHPPKPPAPTMRFGLLPPLVFPTKKDSDKPTAYQLQTATGGFPRFSDRANVFLMPKSSASLLADQKVRDMASSLGFNGKPADLGGSYRWTQTQTLQKTLDIDLQTFNFSLTTDYLSHPEFLAQKNLPPDSQATQLVQNYLTSAIRQLPNDIATVSGTVTYLKSSGTGAVPAVSFSDADFLQVDIMRAPINGISFMTPAGSQGIVHAILTGAFGGNDNILELKYQYHPVDYTEAETYPLRTPEQAWQILQAGAGYIAQKGSADTAVVRDVSLAYYDDFAEQPYLQPVYVFAGDGGFLGYVPAIDPRAIQQVGR